MQGPLKAVETSRVSGLTQLVAGREQCVSQLLALSLPPGSSCTANVPQGQQLPFQIYLGTIWEFVQRFRVIKQWGGQQPSVTWGTRAPRDIVPNSKPFFCRTALYPSPVICRTRLWQPRGAELALPVKKSIHLPWEKAAEAPMALPSWLNFPVSSWCSLNCPGVEFWSTDLSQS